MKPLIELRHFSLWLGLGVSFLTLAAAHPEDQGNDKVFEQQVQPILQARCMPCHDARTRSSGLSVLTKADLLAGGARRGPAVVTGNPESSVLIKMLYGQLSPQMPFGQDPLPPERINQIAAWIRGLKPEAVGQAGSEKWWAFQPVKRTDPPAIKNSSWVRNDIDRFVLQKLEAKGLAPSSESPRQILLRRAFFDLVGIPPKPEEAMTFLSDNSPDAYERLIERLLADPRYGERWGRHWLDLARYADTQGFEADRENYHMWRYRDYVIRAFNDDKPYDRFIQEQIGADELASQPPETQIALGFLRLGPRFQTTIVKEARQLMLDEITSTVGSVFLGLTMKCAQCHDHKYDPIPQKDFYRLQAFLLPIELVDRPVEFADRELRAKMERAHEETSARLKSDEARFKTYQQALMARLGDPAGNAGTAADDDDGAPGKIDPSIANLERRIYRVDANALTPNAEDSTFTLEEKQKYLDLLSYVDGTRGGRDMGLTRRQLTRYEPKAHTVKNADNSALGPALPVAHVRIRGEYNRLGEVVEPGFLSVVTGKPDPASLPADRFGNIRAWRTPLATWIASPENPLTARVMVNRIWQYHFGNSIVNTPSDFGRNGSRPTHPELLDWLALKFVESKWSIKAIHRLIMTSSTYRQTSLGPAEKKCEEIDPGNLLLWRMNRQRLEGEIIRDSVLAVSGRLNPDRGGPGIFPRLPVAMSERLRIKNLPIWEPSDGPETRKRSVYIYQRRQLEVPFLSVMDAPVFQTSCERRGVSTTALQSLMMLNGDLILQEAVHFAERVAREAGPKPAEQIRRAFQLALARPPTAEELKEAGGFLAAADKEGLVGLCRILFNTNEFVYVD
jgi:hypothetical protein